jgi:hypothetical protein
MVERAAEQVGFRGGVGQVLLPVRRQTSPEKIGYLLTPRLFHMQNSSGFASPTRGRDASAGRLGWNYSRRGHPIRR